MAFRFTAFVFVLIALLAGCAHAPTHESTRWAHASQLVLVTIDGWDATHGTLRRYERVAGRTWQPVGSTQPVVIGRTGAAWGLGLNDPVVSGPIKREGDGRSPAGVFTIGDAFGYAAHAETGLRYDAMDAGDYCIDSSDSPLYNRIVDTAQAGTGVARQSTEPMRRDLHAEGDQRYRLGFVIAHNAAGVPKAGSCIFGHLWQSPESTTAGCTAMAPDTMQSLLRWLDARRQPIFVLLPRTEYGRLWQAWDLPRPVD
jgi:L,D-peptidoglycan transpeptidase YkuD (ErfK/YbiS/YcfS/YnhG family)